MEVLMSWGFERSCCDLELIVETVFKNPEEYISIRRLGKSPIALISVAKLRGWVEEHRNKVRTDDPVMVSCVYLVGDSCRIKYPLVQYGAETGLQQFCSEDYLKDIVDFFNGKNTTPAFLATAYDAKEMLLKVTGRDCSSGQSTFEYVTYCSSPYADKITTDIDKWLTECSNGGLPAPLEFTTGDYKFKIDTESFFGDDYKVAKPGSYVLRVDAGDEIQYHALSYWKGLMVD